MLYEFEQCHNTLEAMKNMLYERWRHSWSQYSKQMIQEILLGLQESQRPGRPKIMDSETMEQVIEVIWEGDILQSSMIHHLHDFGKNIWSDKTFDSPLYIQFLVLVKFIS